MPRERRKGPIQGRAQRRGRDPYKGQDAGLDRRGCHRGRRASPRCQVKPGDQPQWGAARGRERGSPPEEAGHGGAHGWHRAWGVLSPRQGRPVRPSKGMAQGAHLGPQNCSSGWTLRYGRTFISRLVVASRTPGPQGPQATDHLKQGRWWDLCAILFLGGWPALPMVSYATG